ncbi:DUF3088 family protein [Kiloniella sp.]|uniref:DUF3088 family protein n=1 Tax=Kiloniella sp. TaxID=1938587 RepID=UPI003B017AB3
MKPILFILHMPFEDNNVEGSNNTTWFCSHCALIEGALAANPGWKDYIDIRRIPFPRPRAELVDILGEDNQWVPVLIFDQGKTLTDPIEITTYLAGTYGGAAPHP